MDKEEELRSKSYIDNDERLKFQQTYENYLAKRKEIDDAYLLQTKVVSDPIVQSVIDKFKARHLVGMKTYGMTMADNPAGILEWVNHAQDELMDGILYLERLKSATKD